MSGSVITTSPDVGPTVDSIMKELVDNGVNEDRKAVASKLQEMIDFFVPIDEARVSVTKQFLKRHGIKMKSWQNTTSKPVKINEIKEASKWVDVGARVSQLWESKSSAVAQKGLLEDETGRISFTIFAKSGLPPLELDQCYSIKNIVTDEYQGRLSVKLNKTTVIEPVDIEIASAKPATIHGAVVAVLDSSGFIKRCPTCKRVLDRGTCKTHGRVEGVQDLVIKAILDNGREMYTLVGDRAITETVIGMDLELAAKMVMECLDAACILEVIKQKLLGRHFIVEGKQNMGYVMPEKFTPVIVQTENVIASIKRAEGL